MNKYELYVRSHNGKAIKAMVEHFSNLIVSEGGEIENIDEWGKRRLAYPIQDFREDTAVNSKRIPNSLVY